jgi:mono/diheme cytochrome c family protein
MSAAIARRGTDRGQRLVTTCGLWLALGAVGCGGAFTSLQGPTDVSPVNGPSWLIRLGLSTDTSSLGLMGGTRAALETGRREPLPSLPSSPDRIADRFWRVFRSSRPSEDSNTPFVLAGADLYRLSCQSCHGPDGLGSPPEINSLLDPVQGTSMALLEQRLKERNRPVDDAFVKEVVAGAEHDLRQRLAEGGKKMAPFKHLRKDETQALIDYLKTLAAVPEASRIHPFVTEPAVRVGEQLVKGTCHICHDATGPRRDRMAIMMGAAVPSLASLATDYSMEEIVAKVRRGSSRMMTRRKRSAKMPVFPYLTVEELAASVVYLAAYPPKP